MKEIYEDCYFQIGNQLRKTVKSCVCVDVEEDNVCDMFFHVHKCI